MGNFCPHTLKGHICPTRYSKRTTIKLEIEIANLLSRKGPVSEADATGRRIKTLKNPSKVSNRSVIFVSDSDSIKWQLP